jgi:hypothetical protein
LYLSLLFLVLLFFPLASEQNHTHSRERACEDDRA